MTGQLLASGREADVFALDDRRVLRRYRRDADVTGEVTAMRYLAGAGYPVPAVHEAAGADMVLDRLVGPTMAEAFSSGRLAVDEGTALLADLLRHLHELPPWPDAAPGHRILHLDLHPMNVLMTDRGPMVIDWCNVRLGDPDLDTGLTALILAQHADDRVLRAFLQAAPGAPSRLRDEVVRFRNHQLQGTEPLDAAVDRWVACAP